MILFDQATKDFKALMRKISGIIQLISRRMRDKNIKSPSPEYLRKKFAAPYTDIARAYISWNRRVP